MNFHDQNITFWLVTLFNCFVSDNYLNSQAGIQCCQFNYSRRSRLCENRSRSMWKMSQNIIILIFNSLTNTFSYLFNISISFSINCSLAHLKNLVVNLLLICRSSVYIVGISSLANMIETIFSWLSFDYTTDRLIFKKCTRWIFHVSNTSMVSCS